MFAACISKARRIDETNVMALKTSYKVQITNNLNGTRVLFTWWGCYFSHAHTGMYFKLAIGKSMALWGKPNEPSIQHHIYVHLYAICR